MDMCMVDYKVPNNMWKKYFCIKVHSTLYISLTFPSLNLLIGTNIELKQSLGKPRFSTISRKWLLEEEQKIFSFIIFEVFEIILSILDFKIHPQNLIFHKLLLKFQYDILSVLLKSFLHNQGGCFYRIIMIQLFSFQLLLDDVKWIKSELQFESENCKKNLD